MFSQKGYYNMDFMPLVWVALLVGAVAGSIIIELLLAVWPYLKLLIHQITA